MAALPQPANSRPGLRAWIDQRTGLDQLLRVALDEPIPGGARFAYVFGSGLLFLFLSQVITGLCLALYYVPSASSAHSSVAYISKQVAAGEFIRSLHVYGASAMIVVLVLHLIQTTSYGAYKRRRELLWLSGAVLAALVLGMAFTGYLLPWDERAYFATSVGTNIIGELPLIGSGLERFVRGGDVLGTMTLSRFYFAHVFLLPGLIFAFIGAHIFLFRRAGAAGPIRAPEDVRPLRTEPFYPRQVIYDMAFAALVICALGLLAHFSPAPLGARADPSDTQFLPRPEWYFLPMFEWLKVWQNHATLGIVVIPPILIALFLLLPFLDRRAERRPWRRPVVMGALVIVVLGMTYLGMLSHVQDQNSAMVRTQLHAQDEAEAMYMKAPFQPQQFGLPLTTSAPANEVPDPKVVAGLKLYSSDGCIACHGADGAGTPIAVSLAKVATTELEATLRAHLQHYTPAMTSGGMPQYNLSPADLDSLIAYIKSLKH